MHVIQDVKMVFYDRVRTVMKVLMERGPRRGASPKVASFFASNAVKRNEGTIAMYPFSDALSLQLDALIDYSAISVAPRRSLLLQSRTHDVRNEDLWPYPHGSR